MAAPAAENVLIFSTLSILQVIKESQQQHGLRHGDYQRYRGYCSRKIRRVRKSLHFTNQHKQKNNFQAKILQGDNVVDSRYLLIPLFEAERCWAFAMQLKQESNTEPRKKFHLINRIRRAAQHSQMLENLCKNSERVDAATKLEAQAYNAWMMGCLNFELQDWQKAKDFLSTSKTIYEKLSSAESDHRLIDSYQQRCQEIAPQLRYCAFSIGDESAAADLMEMRMHMTGDQQENLAFSDLDKLIAQTREKQNLALKSEIVWCGHKINLAKSEKVKTFYGGLKQFEEQLKQAENDEAKLSSYEQLLIDCRDAIQCVRDENKTENLRTKQTQGDDETLSPAQLLHSWLSHVRLSKTIDRYLIMIDQTRSAGDQSTNEQKKSAARLVKPQDLVRLYDTVLQNLTEIQYLPGVQSDAEFVSINEAKMAFFKTFRCFYVAEMFSSLKKWREALALYDRCLDYANKAVKSLKSVKKQIDHLRSESLDELRDIVNAAKYTAHANSVIDIQPIEGQSSDNDNKALMEDLERYRKYNPQDLLGGKKAAILVDSPPDFRPAPCKPLFFDLALNHIRFPSLEEKLESTDKSGQAPSADNKSGLSGLVKGWFWGSSKK